MAEVIVKGSGTPIWTKLGATIILFQNEPTVPQAPLLLCQTINQHPLTISKTIKLENQSASQVIFYVLFIFYDISKFNIDKTAIFKYHP